MPDETMAERLAAVERAVSDGAASGGAVSRGTVTEGAVTEGAVTEGAVTEGAVTEGAVTGGGHERPPAPGVDVADLEERVSALEEEVAELGAAVQAVRGYVGSVKRHDDDLEKQVDLALTKAEAVERALATGGRSEAGESGSPADDAEPGGRSSGDEPRDCPDGVEPSDAPGDVGSGERPDDAEPPDRASGPGREQVGSTGRVDGREAGAATLRNADLDPDAGGSTLRDSCGVSTDARVGSLPLVDGGSRPDRPGGEARTGDDEPGLLERLREAL